MHLLFRAGDVLEEEGLKLFLKLTLQKALELSGAEAGVVSVYGSHPILDPNWVVSLGDSSLAKLASKMVITGWKPGEVLVVETAAADDAHFYRFELNESGVVAVVFFPLTIGGWRIGRVVLVSCSPLTVLESNTKVVLAEMAAEVALAIAAHRKARQAEEMGIRFRDYHHRLGNTVGTTLASLRDALRVLSEKGYGSDLVELYRALASLEGLVRVFSFAAGGDDTPLGMSNLVQQCLASTLDIHGAGTRVKLEVDGTDLNLYIKQAQILTAVLSELVLNSLKHAWPGDGEGKITIFWKVEGGRVKMTYSDDGVGLPAILPSAEDHFGLELVLDLMGQIRGTASFSEPGREHFRAYLDFPD